MRFLLLVICWCLSGGNEARATGLSSGLHILRGDTGVAAGSGREAWAMETHSSQKKQLREVLNEQLPFPVDDATEDDTTEDEEETDGEEATESSEEPQVDTEYENDGECTMYINNMASAMMKKNIGTHNIKESDKTEYLNSGWHVVDPAQPGAVRIVCDEEETYIGLADHCLVWKDGRPTLKKEDEVTAMLGSGQYTIVSHKARPGAQRVSCDNLREFYISPNHKKSLAKGMNKT